MWPRKEACKVNYFVTQAGQMVFFLTGHVDANFFKFFFFFYFGHRHAVWGMREVRLPEQNCSAMGEFYVFPRLH